MPLEGVRVVVKEGPFWEALGWIIYVLSFGRNRGFVTDYLTTIGPVIGIPRSWGSYPFPASTSKEEAGRREAILEHEAVHVGQFRRFGFGSAWLGVLPMFFLYVLLPVPIGFAYFRWRFEREAYAVGIEAQLRLERSLGLRDRELAVSRSFQIERATEQLSGKSYFFAWAIRSQVERWFELNVEHFTQIDVPKL